LSEEQKKIVEENHNLIYYVLHKHKLSIDKYYGAAAEGLCKAAITYSPDKNTKFSVYAYKCIMNVILTEMRKEKRKKRSLATTVSLDNLVGVSAPEDNNPENLIIFQETAEELKRMAYNK
jgi:DNA-directed RNA polymerase specialized sigma subunit